MLHGDLRRRPPYEPVMNRLKEVILPFDPQRPEDIVPPSWRARASLVGLAFVLGALSGLGTSNIVHYVLFSIAALAAGMAVNNSLPGLTMILNMAPFRHGGERTGRWLLNMLYYTVGAVLGYLGGMLPRSWSSDSYGPAALGVLAVVYALSEPPVVSLPSPQWWTQLAAWRRNLYRQLIEYDRFGALIGQVCGTFVPNAPCSADDSRCGPVWRPCFRRLRVRGVRHVSRRYAMAHRLVETNQRGHRPWLRARDRDGAEAPPDQWLPG